MNKIKGWLIGVGAVLSAVLYRMGGSGRWPRQSRIIGISLLTTLIFFFLGCHSWLSLLLSFILLCASISTYWDFLFGYDNFWFHGFMIGLSALPVSLVTKHYYGFGLRCLVLAIFMGAFNKIVNNQKWIPHKDLIEECSRGFAIVITLAFW